MGRNVASAALRSMVEGLRADAVRDHAVPESLAARAGEITLGTMRGLECRSEQDMRRVRAYFWGVIRRRALGSGRELEGIRNRYVAATVAADMLSAGHSPDRVSYRLGSALVGLSAPQDAA